MNRAEELFSAVPKTCNCAQSVAAGCGREDLSAELAVCGGGRAPEGRCGALYAALLLTPPESREALRTEFAANAGSEFCREIKTTTHYPCAQCVALAADLVAKFSR